MRYLRLLVIAICMLVLMWLALRVGVQQLSPRPAFVGQADRSLFPCPPSALNCISSRSDVPGQEIAPLQYDGELREAQNRLREAALAQPLTTLIEERAGYLYVETQSLGFGFIDDTEFEFDAENGVIHVRAASRLGVDDLDVNRQRVEAIRSAFENE